jgi:hypothetical protein
VAGACTSGEPRYRHSLSDLGSPEAVPRGEALFIAVRRADELLDQGNSEECSAWIRIAKAITELERKASADPVN